MRDWIQIQQGILDFKGVMKLKDDDSYIRSLVLCLIHNKEPYVDGINILMVFGQHIELELILTIVPEIAGQSAIESSNFDFRVNLKINTLRSQWLASNLYKAFLGLPSSSSLTHVDSFQKLYNKDVDYKVINTYCQTHSQQDIFSDFESVDKLWTYIQAKNYINDLILLIKSKGVSINNSKSAITSDNIDVNKVIHYGYEPFLHLVPVTNRDIELVKSIIEDSETEEKPYLIRAYENAWSTCDTPFKIVFNIDNVTEAIKISDHQRRKPGTMAPLHIGDQDLYQRITDTGAESTLEWVLTQAETTFPQCNNPCLAVSQEPVWSTPIPYLHFIQDHGQTFALTDDDIKSGFNPFTRNPYSTPPKLHLNTSTYVELWSQILNRALCINS